VSQRYILDEHGTPVPAPDVLTWVRWFEQASHTGQHIVGQDRRTCAGREIRVYTVFLGVDHNVTGAGPPLLYETMIFGTVLDPSIERYATRVQAESGHQRWVRLAFGEQTSTDESPDAGPA
jgi:hypothetical protein